MFETEQNLVDELTALLESASSKVPSGLRCKNQLILKEVNLGYGIADIVVTQCAAIPEKRNIFLNICEIKLLNIINEHPGISVNAIINKTKLSKRKVTRSIRTLESVGLARAADDEINPLGEYINTVKNTIAIEAKLHNWKRALKQAYRYKWFSHKSFVCLPSNTVKSAFRNISLFKDMEVGLIEICKNHGVKILYNPSPKRPISKEMSILLNECVLSELCAS